MFAFAPISLFSFNLGPSVTGIGQIGKTTGPITKRRVTPLQIPWHDPVEHPSDLSLLSWHTRMSEFHGFEKEIDQLENWANSKPTVSIKFITGTGGVGKSRLSAEFADSLKKRKWSAGFANLSKSHLFPMVKAGTLLIIDYPEENKASVVELLNDIASQGDMSKTRVLFLSRQPIDDWAELIYESKARDIIDQQPINLQAIDPKAAYEIYNSTLEKASKIFEKTALGLTEEQVSEWLKLAPENQRPLFVIAAAIYNAMYPEDPVVHFSGRKLVDSLAEREIERLVRLSKNCGCKDHYLFARLLAIAAIAGELHLNRIEQLIQNSELPLQFPSDKDIESELKTSGIYSEGKIPAPKPDIVASAFTVKVLSQKPDIAPELIWTALEPDIMGGLERISRLCYDAELILEIRDNTISNWLQKSLEGNTERCAKAGDFFEQEASFILTKTAIAVLETLIIIADNDEKRSFILNNLSVYCTNDGNNVAALQSIREAVDIDRGLAEKNPARYQPGLADSLNNLSIALSDAGDHAAALSVIQEAVDIRRGLAESSPARYQPDLADSLNNLSLRLSATGDHAAALTAIQEAEKIYRGLAESNPARYLPDMADSLNNLSIALGAVGDHAAALTAIQEAVDIRRGLAESNPARYQPDMADSLNNLSIALGAVGDHAAALTAILEAEKIYRGLAKKNPDRYQPDLASSLNNLSLRLIAAGDHAAGLTTIQEAVDIYRGLAESNPARYQPDLARSLGTLGLVLYILDRSPEASDAATEGIKLLKPLAQKYPHSPHVKLLETLKSTLKIIKKGID